MDRSKAWQAIRRLSKAEFEEKIKPQGLPRDREDLLFKFIQGEVPLSYSCKLDLEEYALKRLVPEVYGSLAREVHPYSSNGIYEYDPAKNGQNMLKHGVGFGEVVSYSKLFGALLVPCPDSTDGERYVIFSDLNLQREGDALELPLPGIKRMNYVISIVHPRDGKYRFISSRLMSSKKAKYRTTMKQAFGEIIPDAQALEGFIDHCVEIVETGLIQPAVAASSSFSN